MENTQARKQKKELVFYIQGYYCGQWADLCGYPCGVRQKNFLKAYREMKQDLKAYRENEPQYPHRYIKRYETIEE